MDFRRVSVRDEGSFPPARNGLRAVPKALAGIIGKVFCGLLCIGLCTGALATPAAAELGVSRATFAREVVGREPVGAGSVFSADLEQLYFFTQILGAGGRAEITHVWIYDGRETAVVPLVVEGDSWRTWSSKRLQPEYKGDWTVEVRDPGGSVLFSSTCRIE